MKILLVEDNNLIAEGLKFSLEKERYSVIVKLNSKEAKEELKKTKLNLIILDIMLPDGNGMELCKYIKENLDIPVIFLTAKDKEEDVIKGFNLGADDYIVKPFRIGELIARAIGIIASYIVYLVSIDYLWYSFEIPWMPITISILAILLVTIISTIYLKKKIFVDDLMDILKREGF